MGLESFYGGRQGASFCIVKRFDAITIEENTKYKLIEYAVNKNNIYYYDNVNGTFISKNRDNFADFLWRWTELDGSTVQTIDVDDQTTISTQTLSIAYQEGMVQCFSKGGDSTDIVNYGEYVIIDTPVKENPDNGKVYRRGMNYDYSPTGNPLAGAEYIGQIVGPRGDTPEVQVEHYDDIVEQYGDKAFINIYTVDDGDITPGSWVDEGTRYFDDDINYVYATMRDAVGNIVGCTLGFKLPTLIQDFEANSITPYTNRAIDPSTGKYYNYDLIEEDPSQYVDGKWQHPFYEKWQIKVPHGYHGINSTNLEIIQTKTMPEGFKEDYLGAALYYDVNCLEPYIDGEGQQVIVAESLDVLGGDDYNPSEDVISAKVRYNDLILYAKKEDCYMDIMRYKETTFDNLEEGESRYIEIGPCNTIERIDITKNGTLVVYYRGIPDPKPLDHVSLRWIDTEDAGGITIDDEGTVTIYYNTTHIDPSTGTKVHDSQIYPNIIKWIDDVEIETTDQSGVEGTGDQKVHLVFNVPDPSDPSKKLRKIIDDPLNYIIETRISIPTQDYPNAPYWHLLVYYSDPALRASLSSKWVTYPSGKYSGQIWTEWVDLGSVKGEPTGIHILKSVSSLNELKDNQGHWIPPERIPDSQGQILNPDGAGWSCILQDTVHNTTTYLFYDYDTEEWFEGASVDPTSVDPTCVIVQSPPSIGQLPSTSDITNLKPGGFWFALEEGISAR